MSKALECAREIFSISATERIVKDGLSPTDVAAAIIQKALDEAEERGAEKMQEAAILKICPNAKFYNSREAEHFADEIRAIDIKQVLKG